MALNPKQRRFAQEYLVDCNGTAAAKRAGYSVKTANEQSVRLLANISIQHEIQIGQKKLLKRTELNAEWVLNRFKEISDRCMQKVPVMVYDPESKSMKQEIDEETGEGVWTFQASGANKATEQIGKQLGVYIEKQEIDAHVTVEVIDAYKTQ